PRSGRIALCRSGACVPARPVKGSVQAILEVEPQRQDPVQVWRPCRRWRRGSVTEQHVERSVCPEIASAANSKSRNTKGGLGWQKLIRRSKSQHQAIFAWWNGQFLSLEQARFGFGLK